MDWDGVAPRRGPDGTVAWVRRLGGHDFDVSWMEAKTAKLVAERGIDLRDAVRVLDDPGHAIEAQGPPYEGQYRVVGLDPNGRLLTLAVTITYPDGDTDREDIGLLRVYTVWHATERERKVPNPMTDRSTLSWFEATHTPASPREPADPDRLADIGPNAQKMTLQDVVELERTKARIRRNARTTKP